MNNLEKYYEMVNTEGSAVEYTVLENMANMTEKGWKHTGFTVLATSPKEAIYSAIGTSHEIEHEAEEYLKKNITFIPRDLPAGVIQGDVVLVPMVVTGRRKVEKGYSNQHHFRFELNQLFKNGDENQDRTFWVSSGDEVYLP